MKDQNQIAVDVFNSKAVVYQEKYMDISPYHKSLDIFCAPLKNRNSKILEVACGPGNITSYVSKMLPDAHILATDLAPKMLELAKNNNPNISVKLLDARSVKSLNSEYNGIISGFCFPYFTKVEVTQFLIDSNEILSLGGLIYISTMEGDDTLSGLKPPSQGDGPSIYMNYHSEEFLTNLFLKNGFDIIYNESQPYDYGKNNKGTDIIMIGKKKGNMSDNA